MVQSTYLNLSIDLQKQIISNRHTHLCILKEINLQAENFKEEWQYICIGKVSFMNVVALAFEA